MKINSIILTLTILLFITVTSCKKISESISTNQTLSYYQPNILLDSSLYNLNYLHYIDSVSGIDIFALVSQNFFYDYYTQIKNTNEFFFNRINVNPTYMDSLDYWMQFMASSSVWENGDPITDNHRNFYIAAEKLSTLYFDQTLLNNVLFDGTTYLVAQNPLISMDDFYITFFQNLTAFHPNFEYLSEEVQDLVLTAAIIVATLQDNCGCTSETAVTRDICEAELKAVLNAAERKFQEEYGKCRNKSKHSKCVHSASTRYEAAKAEAVRIYNQCVAETNGN